MRAGMFSARQKVMPRWAKSRQTPARCSKTCCAVLLELVLPALYVMFARIHSSIARTRE